MACFTAQNNLESKNSTESSRTSRSMSERSAIELGVDDNCELRVLRREAVDAGGLRVQI